MSILQAVFFGYEDIDLQSEFHRRSQRVAELEQKAKTDTTLTHCIQREERIVRAIEKRIDRGEKTIRVNNGESRYEALIAS